MLICAVVAGYLSMFVIAVDVTWMYSFGWTILAWRIADRRVNEKARQELAK
jgi:hypothetical protein